MDVFKDKSWVKWRRIDKEYQAYLDVFLDHALVTSSVDDKIACPCSICANRFYHTRQTVRGHLLMKEMDADYQKCYWIFHGEPTLRDHDVEDDMVESVCFDEDHGSFEHDMDGMIRDAFEPHRPNNKIFEKVVGEDKNGYAKTYGMGRKVPRSKSKRCALEEERAKRKKTEEEQKESQQKVSNLEKKLEKITDLVKILIERGGLSDDLLSSLEDDAAKSESENEFDDIDG